MGIDRCAVGGGGARAAASALAAEAHAGEAVHEPKEMDDDENEAAGLTEAELCWLADCPPAAQPGAGEAPAATPGKTSTFCGVLCCCGVPWGEMYCAVPGGVRAAAISTAVGRWAGDG